MKKLWIVGLIAAVIGAAPMAYAGCGHCEKSKSAACAKGSACAKLVEGITLTDEQKAKVDEIQKNCDGSKEACAKAADSIRAVLTADQQKVFDENAAKCSKPAGGCCSKKGEA